MIVRNAKANQAHPTAAIGRDGDIVGVMELVPASTRRPRSSNSTRREKAVDSRPLVPSSRKASELTIEATYAARGPRARAAWGTCSPLAEETTPDEGERARLISDITRLIREPLMPEPTRTAGLTLIGWLARRMPGEAAHALGVAEAQSESERRLRTAQRKR